MSTTRKHIFTTALRGLSVDLFKKIEMKVHIMLLFKKQKLQIKFLPIGRRRVHIRKDSDKN